MILNLNIMKIIITNNSSKSNQSETDFNITFNVEENEILNIETIKLISQGLFRAFSQSFEQ